MAYKTRQGNRFTCQMPLLWDDSRAWYIFMICSLSSFTSLKNDLVGIQTLGEEYTNIWQYSVASGLLPSKWTRLAVILLPTLPSYLMSSTNHSRMSVLFKHFSSVLGPLVEINLALFYFSGTYYHLVKRLLGVRYVCTLVPSLIP